MEDDKKSDFAYVDKDGEGHLPIHDESHARNAMARWNQTDFDSAADKEKRAGRSSPRPGSTTSRSTRTPMWPAAGAARADASRESRRLDAILWCGTSSAIPGPRAGLGSSVRRSSAVERAAVNRHVVGSNPTAGATPLAGATS